jgi:hypothetical protein
MDEPRPHRFAGVIQIHGVDPEALHTRALLEGGEVDIVGAGREGQHQSAE